MFIIVHLDCDGEVPQGHTVVRFKKGSRFPVDFTEGFALVEELVA